MVEDLGSVEAKYLVKTPSKQSGRIITKEFPCGSHEMTSETDGSERMDMRRRGKISFAAVAALEVYFPLVSESSSLTTLRCGSGEGASLVASGEAASTSFVKAVAASTRCERPICLE